MEFDNGSLSIGSVEVGYRLEGKGTPSVVLLHGLNSHSGTWKKTIPNLVESYTVLAPSLPVHRGAVSAALAGEYADIVSEMMRRLGIKGAVVVGNSMGGWTAMKLALAGDGAVSRLVLEDTAGAGSDEEVLLAGARLPVSIIWGQNDRVIPVSEGRSLHSRLPGSELHILWDSGHVPHWESPETFNGLLLAFLKRQ